MNCHRFHALCGFLVLLLASSAFAQFSSSVQGTVVDPSGAAVAKAQVDITNLDTGVVGHETSDAGGNFRFNSLPPGRYSVNIVLAGFATENVPLTLTTGETRSLPVTLHVAGAQQSIQVTD